MAVGLVATILLATASRSAIAALLIVSGLILGHRLLQSRGMMWLRQRPAATALLLLGLLGASALAVYAFRASEFVGQAPASLAIRINYWRASLAMLTQHPWIGIGPDNSNWFMNSFELRSRMNRSLIRINSCCRSVQPVVADAGDFHRAVVLVDLASGPR